MFRISIALAAGLGLAVGYAAPAHACGVKLTLKSPRIRREMRRSANPTHILLVGAPPRRFARDLEHEGHKVEIARTPNSAQRKSYGLVIADPSEYRAAKQAYPHTRVIRRSDNGRADLARVERVLRRSPTISEPTRTAIASRDKRQPIAAGPAAEARRSAGPVRAAGHGTPATPASANNTGLGQPSATGGNNGASAQPAASNANADNSATPASNNSSAGNSTADNGAKKPPEVAMNAKPAHRPSKPIAPPHRAEEHHHHHATSGKVSFTGEIFFATNSSHLNHRSRRGLRHDASWLKAHSDVSITVEGHTDASGPADYNMALSQRRAESARDFLVKQGIDASRIHLVALGEEQPKYDSAAKNRRVAIKR